MQGLSAARTTPTGDVRCHATAPTRARARAGRRSLGWYCPESHTTFSLLPECLAARFPGELDEVEAVVAHAERAPSLAAAADALRRDAVELPGAMRWVGRRVRLVHHVLRVVIGLLPEPLARCVAEMGAVRTRLHTETALRALRTRREAQARLQHLIELRGIGLLTGEVGSGKTTVCRNVAATLHPGRYRVCYISLTTGNVLDMYTSIGWELGLPTERSRATAYRAIRAEITRLVCEAKQLPVLVIDEAQHLRNDVLEDLRLLTNFAMDAEHRLCLLLVGLTELRRRLAMAVHESLTQRLVVRHHLPGLERNELDDYLTHRLRLAGCEIPLFEPPAVEALFQSARGLPRLVNRIAHYALSAAALDNARTVNPEHLQHAVEELRL